MKGLLIPIDSLSVAPKYPPLSVWRHHGIRSGSRIACPLFKLFPKNRGCAMRQTAIPKVSTLIPQSLACMMVDRNLEVDRSLRPDIKQRLTLLVSALPGRLCFPTFHWLTATGAKQALRSGDLGDWCGGVLGSSPEIIQRQKVAADFACFSTPNSGKWLHQRSAHAL